MQTENTFPSWCSEAWAMHQIFRTLGLPAEDIYLLLDDEGESRKVSVVAKEGELTFSVCVDFDRSGASRAEAEASWGRFVRNLNERASDAERSAIGKSTRVHQELPKLELILKMIDKGFTLACLPPEDQEKLREWRRQNPPPVAN